MSHTFYNHNAYTPEADNELKNDFARVTYFDRSTGIGFGFGGDRLGQLSEMNK
jgi:hypothetical protein